MSKASEALTPAAARRREEIRQERHRRKAEDRELTAKLQKEEGDE